MHVLEVLRTTLDENLKIIEDSIAYLVSHGREVVYDAEHFFDSYKSDRDYAIETLKAAEREVLESSFFVIPMEAHSRLNQVEL